MKKMALLYFILFLVSINADSYTLTKEMICSEQDKDFDGLRYREQIAHCKRNVSTRTKRQIYDSFGIGRNDQKKYYIDHLISLSMGGSNHRDNLFPVLDELSTTKIENQIFQWLKNGEITQQKALTLMVDIKTTLFDY